VVVDGGRKALRATKVALSRLNRDVAEQELDLLQLTARSSAQAYAGAAAMPNPGLCRIDMVVATPVRAWTLRDAA
jgi:hypothetical protein